MRQNALITNHASASLNAMLAAMSMICDSLKCASC